jgi:hypothetical protein
MERNQDLRPYEDRAGGRDSATAVQTVCHARRDASRCRSRRHTISRMPIAPVPYFTGCIQLSPQLRSGRSILGAPPMPPPASPSIVPTSNTRSPANMRTTTWNGAQVMIQVHPHRRGPVASPARPTPERRSVILIRGLRPSTSVSAPPSLGCKAPARFVKRRLVQQ